MGAAPDRPGVYFLVEPDGELRYIGDVFVCLPASPMSAEVVPHCLVQEVRELLGDFHVPEPGGEHAARHPMTRLA